MIQFQLPEAAEQVPRLTRRADFSFLDTRPALCRTVCPEMGLSPHPQSGPAVLCLLSSSYSFL